MVPPESASVGKLLGVTQVTPDFEGSRSYVFEGGCVTFLFRLKGEERGEALALATEAVGMIARSNLAKLVDENSNGQLSLDPPDAEGSGR